MRLFRTRTTKRRLAALFVVVALPCASGAAMPLPFGSPAAAAATSSFRIPTKTQQLVVGIADEWGSTRASLQRFERTADGWQPVGEPFAARLGPTGLAWGLGLHPRGGGTFADEVRSPTEPKIGKREGDKRAPAGVFALRTAFGYDGSWADRTKLRFVEVGPRDLFVDNPDSPLYNAHVRLDHEPRTRFEREEQMLQKDPAHRLQVLVEHNTDPAPIPGRGSAIFIHIWRRNGASLTAGCTAVSDADIETLVEWLDPASRPLYVLLPRATYEARQAAWRLPPL